LTNIMAVCNIVIHCLTLSKHVRLTNIMAKCHIFDEV